ncbi:MAG: HNH endonuclease [Planctomycetota bacterium]
MNAVHVLEQRALVLNRNWTPVQTTSVKEAISLVARGAAVIIDADTYEVHDLETWNDVSRASERFGEARIRSAHLALAAPDVVRLTHYGGAAERSVVFSRRNIFKRDRFTCQYCGRQARGDDLTIDHVVPRCRGGVSSWKNCVLACTACNKKKADRTPAGAGMTLRRRPRRPTWRTLANIAPDARRASWEKFLSKAYWDIELEP